MKERFTSSTLYSYIRLWGFAVSLYHTSSKLIVETHLFQKFLSYSGRFLVSLTDGWGLPLPTVSLKGRSQIPLLLSLLRGKPPPLASCFPRGLTE